MLCSLLLYPILLNIMLSKAYHIVCWPFPVNTCITDKTGKIMICTCPIPSISCGENDPAKQARLFSTRRMTY